MRSIIILIMFFYVSGFIFGDKTICWFDKKVPLEKAEIFGVNIISTSGIEFSPSVSSDNRSFYYVVSSDNYSLYKIIKRDITQNGFGKAEVITKPSIKREYSPFPYKNKLYYSKVDENTGKSDIYYKQKTGDSLSEVVRLSNPINTEYIEGFLSVSQFGTICFESDRPGGFGKGDIYLAYPSEENYTVVNAGIEINSQLNESDAFIARDESFIIITVYNKKGGYGVSDLYITFKENNKYSKLINMGSAVNSSGLEHNPHVSPDGKYFFFSSNKKTTSSKGAGNGNFDIYWISSNIIFKLKETVN